jgi:hypothetical protein
MIQHWPTCRSNLVRSASIVASKFRMLSSNELIGFGAGCYMSAPGSARDRLSLAAAVRSFADEGGLLAYDVHSTSELPARLA